MVTSQIDLPTEAIAEFCRRRGIARLELFGSALREDVTDSSDLDFLYVLDDATAWGFSDLLDAQDELARITVREVDLISRATIEESTNPWRRKRILGEARVVYSA
jgi:hypothetical protein